MCKAANLETIALPTFVPPNPELLVRTEPLDAGRLASLNVDAENATCVEIKAGAELYNLVCAHIVESQHARSYSLDIGSASRGGCCGDDDDDCSSSRVATKALGLGIFSFAVDDGRIHAIHSTLGEVVGTDCGPALLRSLILVSENGIELVTAFCDSLIAAADATSGTKFNIFRWHVQYQYWRKAETVTARTVDSVVLPSALRAKVEEDLSDFVSPSTKEGYLGHGTYAGIGTARRRCCWLSRRLTPWVRSPHSRYPVQAFAALPRLARRGQDVADPGARGPVQAQRLLPLLALTP
jgi:hypothetical protein